MHRDQYLTETIEKLLSAAGSEVHEYAWKFAQLEAPVGAKLRAVANLFETAVAEHRAALILALGHLGKPARAEFSRLIPFVSRGSAETRANAAWALGQISANRPRVVTALTEALGDPEQVVRIHAAHSLALIGKDAKSATNRIAWELEHPEMVPACSWALDRINSAAG